jgi:hypothetical protein
MIRKSISCALAGLLTVVPALAFLFGLFGHWQPGSGLVALSLIFSFAVGVIWLGTEVSEIFRSKKPCWEEQYAQNIYGAFVVSNDPGNITALKLRIPTALHHAYQNKIVQQRELISFAALMSVANPQSGLGPVILAYEDLLVHKMADRGLQMSGDQLAKAAIEDVEAMHAQPFGWAQRWLSEFGDDPKDSYIPFANHCVKLFQAYTIGIEKTRPR